MVDMIHNLCEIATSELNKLYSTSDWSVRVYRLDWQTTIQSTLGQTSPTIKLVSFASNDSRWPESIIARATAASTLLHTPVAGTETSTKGSTRSREGSEQQEFSVFAVPILHPSFFQPNPGMPLLIGTAAFAGPLAVSMAIKDYKLGILADKYAGLFADIIQTQVTSSSFPAEALLAKSIDVNTNIQNFDLNA
jgi:hypothetical protein